MAPTSHKSVSLKLATYERLAALRDTPFGKVSFSQVIERLMKGG